MKIKLLFAALLLSTSAIAAQPAPLGTINSWPVKESAFTGGEKLTFGIGYSLAKYLNGDVGEVVFQVSNTIINNVPAYRIHGNAKTLPNYRMLYDLDDTYQSWLEMSTLRPLKYSSRLKEAKYRYRADYAYDWDKMEVHSTYQNMKRPTAKQKTMKLTADSGDALAVFYNLRSEDIVNFKPGENKVMIIVLDDTIRRINYKYLNKETKTIRKLGTFRTLKFSCQIATSTGESFKDGSEFYLWISDDRNHVPLYIESPIKVGSIAGALIKYEGLKYPLDSKVK